jgi:Tol biopolymer transport system component
VTTLTPQQLGQTFPSFLPDGRRFLFSAGGELHLGELGSSAVTRLTPSNPGNVGMYLPAASGEGPWLLWGRAGTLVAQRLDIEQATLTGEPVVAADRVGAVSVAASGLLAYRTAVGSQRQLTWLDRSGSVQGTIGEPDATLQNPRVAPDGHRVAVSRTVQGNLDLWLLSGARTSRFTFDVGADRFPVWSPDGTRIVYRLQSRSSSGEVSYDLHQKLTSGAGVEEPFFASDQGEVPTSWSPDGRFLLYYDIDPQTVGDLWVVPTAENRKATGSTGASNGLEVSQRRTSSAFLKTPFREVYGEFSPDGRWVAYHSNESGRPEVWVRPFVPPGEADATAGARWQVSTAGGIFPVWRPDGKELYYLSPSGAMMAASITVTGATLEPGAPVMLFATRIVGGGIDAQQGRQYDIARDGRFLINMEQETGDAPITLLQNWDPARSK